MEIKKEATMFNKRLLLIAIIFFLMGVGAVYFYRQIINLTSVQNNALTNTPNPSHIKPQESGPIYDSEVQRVMAEGYTAYGTHYNDSFRLHILIGIMTGSADGYAKKAFFFNNGLYLGTDTSDISAVINSLWRDDKTIALEYTLYRKDNPMCCPTGGSKIVRFQWDGKKLNALDPIPTDDWDADLSRR